MCFFLEQFWFWPARGKDVNERCTWYEVLLVEEIHLVLYEILQNMGYSQCQLLVGGFKYVLFSPLLGEMIHLTNIFQIG